MDCGGGWRGRRGRGERGPGRGEAAPGRAGGGPWSCVSRERRRSCARGWGSGAALSAAPPSPRMPSGAPVRGSRSRARAARAPRDGPLAGPLSSASPSPSPEVVSAVPGPLRGREGLVEGQMLGVFCAHPRVRGARSWEGSGSTKQSGLVGRCSGGGGPQSRLGWGQRRKVLERVEKSAKQSDRDLMRWRTGASERRMLADAALLCLSGRPAFPHNRVCLGYFACAPRCYAVPSRFSFFLRDYRRQWRLHTQRIT